MLIGAAKKKGAVARAEGEESKPNVAEVEGVGSGLFGLQNGARLGSGTIFWKNSNSEPNSKPNFT